MLTPPPKPRHNMLVLFALVATLLFAGALVAVFAVTQHVSVSVDGRQVTVKPGATVGDLMNAGNLQAHPGRLISVKGTVIQADGGSAPTIWRNGRRVGRTEPVFDGDVITSSPGADKTESTVTYRVPIPFKTRMVGSGPVMHLSDPGSVGISERVEGEVSRSVVSSRTALAARDMVITRARITSKDKLVALTFDDGPWKGQTNKILDILKREHIHATFFMLGIRVEAVPTLAKRVAAEGNLIGDHTLSHKLLTTAKPKEISRQIRGGMNWIQKATGVKTTWFRPPYGAINQRVWAETRAFKLRVALWDVDTLDWTRPGVNKIVKTVNKQVRPGDIILMHDGGGDRSQTIKALPKVIQNLKKRGYTFVTLQELATAP